MIRRIFSENWFSFFAPPARRRVARWLAGGACAATLAACGGQGERRGREEIAAPAVEAVQARFGGLPLVERMSGTVYAENQVALLPEISGRIVAVHVESGDTVERGQPLVSLDDQQYREQVRQAAASHRISEARVRQAKAALAEVQAQERRLKTLGARELVSDQELETLAAQVESARADVALAEAQLDEAAATLAEQQELLTKSVVRAPIAGVVGQRNAEVGMHASASTRLFTIGNLSRVKVRVNVTDSMLRFIEAGQPIEIITRTADGVDRVLRATLTRISPFLNEITRTADAEIEINNAEGVLRPGMFVPVDVLYGQSQQATLVPSSALFTDPNTGNVGVFVVDAGDGVGGGDPPVFQSSLSPRNTNAEPPPLSEPRPVEFRTIKVIARGASEVAIDSLQPGDWVVTLGQDLLSTGRNHARVRPVTWEHVMELQGLKREDLLQEVLRATAAGTTGGSSE